MAYHHVAALAKLSGLTEILLIGFFEPALFQGFLDEATVEFPGLSIRYLREYQSLGTGGGLYHFRDQILRGNPTSIIVVHSDVCCSFPFAQMLDFHRHHKALCTILGTLVCIFFDLKHFR
jgi:mannose-1-phosphate guanylyltransferase